MGKKWLLGVAALILGVMSTGSASAHEPVGGPRGGYPVGRPYYRTSGVRYSSGYYYRGRQHDHWGHRTWNTRYGRTHYWDPGLRCYYYWSAPRGCYLPCDGPSPF